MLELVALVLLCEMIGAEGAMVGRVAVYLCCRAPSGTEYHCFD